MGIFLKPIRQNQAAPIVGAELITHLEINQAPANLGQLDDTSGYNRHFGTRGGYTDPAVNFPAGSGVDGNRSMYSHDTTVGVKCGAIREDAAYNFGAGGTDHSFSFAASIKTLNSSTFRIFSKGGDTTNIPQFNFTLTGGSQLGLYLYDGASANSIRSVMNSAWSYNNLWKRVVATYDGSQSQNGINLYVNGSLVAQTKSTAGTYVRMTDHENAVQLGRWYNNGTVDFSHGYIDQFKIYDDVMTAAQIAADFAEYAHD